MIKASVVGATGYAGLETVRILSGHPDVRIVHLGSHSFAGRRFSEVYPSMSGVCDLVCADETVLPVEADVIFASLPHGVSQDAIPSLLATGARVIDLSGDFRYLSAPVYEKAYGATHKHPDLLAEAVYGLPELHREAIRTARLVANPGCYPTSAILAAAPLLAAGLADPASVIVDAVSGVSGAGRSSDAAYQFCEVQDNFKAYKVASHRHTSEMEQEMGLLAGVDMAITFTPHLAPFKRGMLSTVYLDLKKDAGLDADALRELYANHYRGEYFVRVLPNGSFPEVKYTAGSNFADIGTALDARTGRAIVISSIDNLGKGAAGQAVQNMNIFFGLPETTGLASPGWYL